MAAIRSAWKISPGKPQKEWDRRESRCEPSAHNARCPSRGSRLLQRRKESNPAAGSGAARASLFHSRTPTTPVRPNLLPRASLRAERRLEHRGAQTGRPAAYPATAYARPASLPGFKKDPVRRGSGKPTGCRPLPSLTLVLGHQPLQRRPRHGAAPPLPPPLPESRLERTV